MARARGEESEMNNAMGLTTPLPEAASTQYFTLDDDGDVFVARPLALDEHRPQVRVLRRTVEQIGDVSFLWFLLSPILCRRWWTSWWPCLPATIRRLPTRLSKCPKSRALPLWSYCSLYAADVGTAGDSADDPLLSQADRWHSW